jgi:hypothetical protein
MTKKLSFDRPNRRDFLRTGIIGGAGLVVAQFALPKELQAQTMLWTGQIQASSDDAYENGSTGLPNLTSTTIGPTAGGPRTCGFRFLDVTIPNSAAITAATITLYATSTIGEGTCSVYLQAADNPSTFTTTKFDVSGRTKTTHYGTFSFTYGSSGWTSSSDISAAVQEVVDRQPVGGVGGWVSGNAMVVLTWMPPAFGEGAAYAWDYNNGGPPNLSAELSISYTT